MEYINLLIAFNLGLFSTLHCLGMCGGIIGALSLGIKPDQSQAKINRIKFSVAYNTGRITSYALAGAIAGFAGQRIITGIMPESGHLFLQFIAAAVLVLIGLHLAGWLPKLGKIEAIGYSFWRFIQPVSKRFLPVTHPGQAFAIGMIWGWLPCALVYSVLLWSLGAGSAITGGALMFAFGLGTLPGMITAGVIGESLTGWLKTRAIRVWAGVIIIFFGLVSPFLHVSLHKHEHHGHNHEHNSASVNHYYHFLYCRHHPSVSGDEVFRDHHTGLI